MTAKQQTETDLDRRRFLGGAALLGGLTVSPGVILYGLAGAKPVDQPVTNAVRWGILVDTRSCSDCDVCVEACQAEHGIAGDADPSVHSRWIRKVEVKDNVTGYVQELPLFCQHCEHPPCVDVCPTGASFKRADGIVLVDKHICIGCRYCMMACPYKARSFIHEPLDGQLPHSPRGKGTVESCTMCVHRVDEGEQPACVDACNRAGHKTMFFGDLNDPNSEISQQLTQFGGSQLRADLGLDTGVRYRGLE